MGCEINILEKHMNGGHCRGFAIIKNCKQYIRYFHTAVYYGQGPLGLRRLHVKYIPCFVLPMKYCINDFNG